MGVVDPSLSTFLKLYIAFLSKLFLDLGRKSCLLSNPTNLQLQGYVLVWPVPLQWLGRVYLRASPRAVSNNFPFPSSQR